MTIDATQIPHGRRIARLGDVAEVAFSSVDKKTVDGELPVELCNYTDVFYNPRIARGMPFMAATASPAECERWTLRQGDVLFTKDSETPDEIGIPAYVPEDLPGVLCGYHLGRARPASDSVSGAFLARALGSHESAREFARIANGVTRFGLTLEATRSLPILLPPLAEQHAIAAILDGIDEAIERTEEVIAATERLRDALLHELLTRGLPGRHSEWVDVPGLGTVPACWDVVRLGDAGRWLSGGTPSKARADYWAGTLPWVSPKDMKAREISGAEDHISDDAARAGSRVVPEGTIFVVVRGMILAHSFPLAVSRVMAAFNQDIRALVCRDELLPDFVLAALEHQKPRLLHLPTPSTHGTMRVDTEELFAVRLPLPPLDEQRAIVDALGGLDASVERAREERAQLQSLQASVADALLTGRVRARI